MGWTTKLNWWTPDFWTINSMSIPALHRVFSSSSSIPQLPMQILEASKFQKYSVTLVTVLLVSPRQSFHCVEVMAFVWFFPRSSSKRMTIYTYKYAPKTEIEKTFKRNNKQWWERDETMNLSVGIKDSPTAKHQFGMSSQATPSCWT